MREGYKETAIGIIPEDWDVKKIGEIAKVKGRIGYRGYTKSDLVKKGEGALTIGAKHINGNSKLYFDDPEYISWAKFEESPEIKVNVGDILLVQRGSIGKVAFVKELHEPATINPSMVLIKNSKCNNSFLFYFLNGEFIQDTLRKIVTSTAVPMISQDQIKNLYLALPADSEQSKIVSILSTVDDKIDAINERITQTQQLKNGLMQQLLTKGIGHTKFKDSPLGEIPESWEVVKLGNVLNRSPEYGANASAIEFSNDTYRYIRITDINANGKLIKENRVGILKSLGGQYILNENDVLIARTGNTVGKSYMHKAENGESAFAGYLIRFVLNEKKYNSKLFSHFLHSSFFWIWVKNTLRTGAQPNINSQEYQALTIPKPPISEQFEISMILSSVDEKLDVLQEKKIEYEKLKNGLMQKLLTGQIRVSTIN